MPPVRIAPASAVPEGEARVLKAGDAEVAVFHAGDRFHACRNVCPHRGGPIGEGDFDGRVVTCPWHGWQFDVTTGVNLLMPAAKLEMYPAELAGGEIQVTLP